jgi:hypothetical protein
MREEAERRGYGTGFRIHYWVLFGQGNPVDGNIQIG